MKKILFLVNVDWFFISHRLPIAQAAAKSGYEVHIATGITNKQDELEAEGFIVHPLPINRGKASLASEILTFRSIINTLKEIKPDLLHLITIKPVLYGGLAAHFYHRKGIITSISGLGYVFTKQGLIAKIRRFFISLIYRLALKHPKLRIIFQNSDDKRLLMETKSISQKQVVMIPGSGTDLSLFKFSPEPSCPLIVIMASRLLVDKGVCEFVDAAALIHQQHPEVIFKLVGSIDPDNPASITPQQIEQWQHTSHIEFLGQCNDIPDLFSQAHIVVLPSYREGFPKVLIEAAACGRAIVTTDVPGCRDSIVPDETGLLVPAQNTSALANAIERLILDTVLRNKMGIAGRKLAEKKYDIQKVVNTHMKIYKELLGEA